MSEPSQAIDRTFPIEGSAPAAHSDAIVTNAADRLFYIVTRAFAALVIILGIALVINLIHGAWEAIQTFGLGFLVGTTWNPVTRQFSTLPTIIGTMVKASLGLMLAVPISI